MKSRIFVITSILFFSFSYIHAQITIGGELTPNEGALLDLKQYEPKPDNTTAIKGLGIPRVNLTTPIALSDITDAVGLESEHTGLVVYNINRCLNKTGRDDGMYVWDGTRWRILNNNMLHSPNVYTLSDTRNGVTETYTYSRFGAAGIWMTENMRATHFADGTPIALYDGTNQHTTPAYAYPSSTPSGWNTPTTSYDDNPKQGLLYNWSAATNKYSGKNGAEQGQESGSTPASGGKEVEADTSLPDQDYRNYYVVQGICPDGWHVPSDREWNELEKEIYENADKYSTYTNEEVNTTTGWNSTDPWVDGWEWGGVGVGLNERGSSTSKGHGFAMQHPCYLTNTNYAEGTSKSSIEGGFDILLTGNATLASGEYDSRAFMWSSSSVSSNIAYSRFWTENSAKVSRDRTYRRVLHSVRCKKNDLNP